MGSTRIVGLKIMHSALRRLQLEHCARVVLTQKGNQFSTQTQSQKPEPRKVPQNTEIPREDKSGGSGGGMKFLLTVGVVAGAGGAAYYYWNGNERDPFTWVNDQLPITKKKAETKLAVSETGGLKIKNNPNQVMAATEKTGEKTQVLRSSSEKAKSTQEAPKTQDSPVKSEPKATEKIQPEKKIEEVLAVPSPPIESPKNAENTISERSQQDSLAANAEATQTPVQASETIDVEALKLQYETELLKALTRQAQVYQETYDQSRNVLKSEYERKLKLGSEISEAEHMVELRAKYGQATAALAAMEEALKGRREQEITSDRSRKLWTYCNNIYHQVNYQADANSEAQKAVSTYKASLLKEFSSDPFVVQLLKTLPDSVESTESLRVRFFNVVDSSCRKVALFKNGEKITLLKYLLGSLQESLVTKCEGESVSVNTPFEILDRTAFHLKRGDLLEAVCTLNKIQGLPREISRDWLADARLVLEANQALFALMTYATANNNFM